MDISSLIVYENDTIVALNKPHGLLVHKSSIAADAKEFALQMVREYCEQKVYLAHRLDRKTSGVLLFSKNEEENIYLNTLFSDKLIQKTYRAIVRGHTDDNGIIDYPLKNDRLKVQEAVTHYKTISRYEINLLSERHATSRYSLVELYPTTGRYHQLRKHMAHIRHPIIGDRPHGCNKQNRIWKAHFDMITMLLHAERLIFNHKKYGTIEIYAPINQVFSDTLDMLRVQNIS